ncbi:TonB-dependent receptor domain-containing protein [Halomonas heilongjiangensis]|uniref:TonB-dependent receptor n=1 Tax=Halomonas heilongjiangensis TaxID=1387883 RepID=A0A2N7TT20_9GAMM|nr:TonB-dependent receptor [Halomonas heilongjiangensis]PMR71339.1 TonB-dependent receptor [Halomonas heilongjiangensis]PXX88610.1 TonB-dependent receptor [Halomonas heilongjiangensis]
MNTRIHAVRGLAAFGLAALPLTVNAQTAAAETEESLRLNPMVVTATLAPRTADQSLASVTVLDEATLRRQDPTSLTDLLRGQPGVDVSTNGSFGKHSSVFIRGTNSDQHVLLIDGIRLRSATAGGPAWQFLDPRLFQRAEIVRGPRGSLYGADAVGGVVQLFTHEAEEGGPHPRMSAGGGSFGSQRYSAGLSGGSGGTRYTFAGSHFSTDGRPIRRDGEDKGFDNTSGLARLSHTFDNGSEIGAMALRARGNTEIDNGDTDFVQQVAGIYGELPVTDNWRSRLTLSESRDEQESQRTFGDSTFDTRLRTARWENTLRFGPHDVIFGAEFDRDDVTTTENYTEKSRDNRALFAQGLLDFHPVTLQTSLRHDDNEAFGDELTGNLALGYALDDWHTLRASYGTAFRAPTFNDLYYPYEESTFFGTTYLFEGNQELEAETSSTYELGVRGQYRSLFWDFALYQTDVDNLIDWASDSPAPDVVRYRPTNVADARIRGAELASGAELDDWTLQVALTYLDTENRETGNNLPRRASRSLRLDVDREFGDWELGASWTAQNHRYDDVANEHRLAGFGTLNLRAGWQFAPLWSARLTVENALDKEYETSRDYINAGRAAFVSVHFGQ